jgi:hypothetical protein
MLAAATPASFAEPNQGSSSNKQGCVDQYPNGELLAPHGTVVTGDPSKTTDKGTKRYKCDNGKWVEVTRRFGSARHNARPSSA